MVKTLIVIILMTDSLILSSYLLRMKLFFKSHQHPFNNITTILHLLFIHHQRRRKTNNITVRRFSQQTVFGQFQADIPGSFAVLGIIDTDGIE